jgi:hypothetical protein
MSARSVATSARRPSARPTGRGRADSNPMIVATLNALATLISLYDLLLLGLGTH